MHYMSTIYVYLYPSKCFGGSAILAHRLKCVLAWSAETRKCKGARRCDNVQNSRPIRRCAKKHVDPATHEIRRRAVFAVPNCHLHATKFPQSWNLYTMHALLLSLLVTTLPTKTRAPIRRRTKSITESFLRSELPWHAATIYIPKVGTYTWALKSIYY